MKKEKSSFKKTFLIGLPVFLVFGFVGLILKENGVDYVMRISLVDILCVFAAVFVTTWLVKRFNKKSK